MIKKIIAYCGVFLFAVASYSQRQNDLPLDHWLYSCIEQLQCRGYFSDSRFAVKPFKKADVINELKKINTNSLKSERFLVSRFIKADDIFDNDKQGAIHFELQTESNASTFMKDQIGLIGRPRLEGMLGALFSYQWRIKISNGVDLGRDDFIGREWKGVTGYVTDGYLRFNYKDLDITLGRQKLWWGSPRFSSLILSDNAPPLDMVSGRFYSTRFQFSAFFGSLRSGSVDSVSMSLNRYIAGHRFTFNPVRCFSISASETVIFGGLGRPIEMVYLNPFLPYYWTQWYYYDYTDHTNWDDNILWEFDFRINPKRGVLGYAQVVIDDWIYGDEKEPNKYGFTIGLQLADIVGAGDLIVEYSQIRRWTYNHRVRWNRYLNGNGIIGSWLGPDAEYFICQYTQDLSSRYQIGVKLSQVRTGAADKADIYPSGGGFLGYTNEKFPSGIVTTSSECQIFLKGYNINKLCFDFCLGYTDKMNINHVKGNKKSGFGFLVFGSWSI